MADVTLKYKGATIAELSESGSKTLETAGKYCEADILLEYIKSGGGLDIFDTATGEFTLESNLVNASTPITHGLGKVPFVVFVIPEDDTTPGVKAHIGGVTLYARGTYGGFGFYLEADTRTHNPRMEQSTSYINNFTTNTFNIQGSANYPYLENIKHVWIAAAFKE